MLNLAKGIDAGQQTDDILLDFAKAFEKVPHHYANSIITVSEAAHFSGWNSSGTIQHGHWYYMDSGHP